MKTHHALAALALLALAVPAAAGEPPAALPPAMREVDIDEHLGGAVNPELVFTDMNGRRVRLGDYLNDGKPVLLTLAYYRCPMLCGLVLRGAVEGMKKLSYRLDADYHAITVSFDPRETAGLAREKRVHTLQELGAPDDTAAWPFLIGEEASSRALADQLGFRYAYDPRTDQYAHPAALFVLTPDGRISRYLYGAEFGARDLRLALLDASAGRIGSIVDRVLMTCYRYDPTSRRYGPYILGFFRLGALLILLTVGSLIGGLVLRERRLQRRAAATSGDRLGGPPC